MPGFRWKLQQDIALCTEVCKVRPHKQSEWLEVAETLNEALGIGDQLKGKGCKDRLVLLSKKYADEDKRSLKRLVQ